MKDSLKITPVDKSQFQQSTNLQLGYLICYNNLNRDSLINVCPFAILGTLRSSDADGNENVTKIIDLMSKTTTS